MPHRRRSLVPFVALAITAALAAQEPAWIAGVNAAIETHVRHRGVPGLSCAVGVGTEIPFRIGVGFADVENDVPATPQTVYRLGSISKPVTAVLAMQLAEAGALDLDADVNTIVKEWPQKQWPVTTRQLLGHLGGVRHYNRRDMANGECTVHYATQTDALERFAADPLLHEPGTKYVYSTFGYNLIAAVVEAKSGKPFADVVNERVAVPAAAPTLQDDHVRRIIRGRAQGYLRVDGKLQNSQLMDGSYKLGGGGLCASVEDLVRFAQALIDGKLVKPETLQQMWTEQATKDGTGVEYGLGFRVDRANGRLVVAHGGAQSRVSTMLLLLPEQRVVVAVMCNLEDARVQPLARQIADLVAPVPQPVTPEVK